MSETPKPAKLAELLASGGQNLGRLLARTRDLEALTGKVRAALPAPDADHVVAVSASGHELVVTVDSAAWAARLRFSEPAIRAAVGQSAEDRKLVVRVRQPAVP
ncbi:MAG: DUF721 domain-containing protein [Gammaproteobacteria bacterium]|nr:DUF721 domain-containing protein [Gammaproteobacteria bacterium]